MYNINYQWMKFAFELVVFLLISNKCLTWTDGDGGVIVYEEIDFRLWFHRWINFSFGNMEYVKIQQSWLYFHFRSRISMEDELTDNSTLWHFRDMKGFQYKIDEYRVGMYICIWQLLNMRFWNLHNDRLQPKRVRCSMIFIHHIQSQPHNNLFSTFLFL